MQKHTNRPILFSLFPLDDITREEKSSLPSTDKSVHSSFTNVRVGRAVAQGLDVGVPPRRPGSRTGSMWGLWWTKRHWAGFLRVLRFPLPIIPPISPLSYSPEADTIGH
jgi:hypothetical protein